MWRALVGFTSLLLFAAAPVGACPVCDSDIGREVRAGIVDGDFARNVLATVLPFAVVLGGVAAFHFNWPRGRRGG